MKVIETLRELAEAGGADGRVVIRAVRGPSTARLWLVRVLGKSEHGLGVIGEGRAKTLTAAIQEAMEEAT